MDEWSCSCQDLIYIHRMIRSEKDSSHVLNVWIKSQPLRSKKGGNRSELKIAQHSKVGNFLLGAWKIIFHFQRRQWCWHLADQVRWQIKKEWLPVCHSPDITNMDRHHLLACQTQSGSVKMMYFLHFPVTKNLQGQGIVFPQLTKSTSQNLDYLSFTPFYL